MKAAPIPVWNPAPVHIGPDQLANLCRERWIEICRLFCLELGLHSRPVLPTLQSAVDFALFQPGNPANIGLVRCLTGQGRPLGDSLVESFFQLLQIEDVANGIIFTTGTVSPRTRETWKGSALDLIDREDFPNYLEQFSPASVLRIEEALNRITFNCPICPRCGIPMTKAQNKVGPFWQCGNAPGCPFTYMA